MPLAKTLEARSRSGTTQGRGAAQSLGGMSSSGVGSSRPRVMSSSERTPPSTRLAEAAAWLLRHRRIRSLGVDTLSIDRGTSTAFDTHLLINGADRYGLENLANLQRIPPYGAKIIVGLIPFQQGSGGQARIFATW